MRCEIRLVSDERVLTLKHCVKVNISGGGWSSCVIHTRTCRNTTGSTCGSAGWNFSHITNHDIALPLCRSDTPGQQAIATSLNYLLSLPITWEPIFSQKVKQARVHKPIPRLLVVSSAGSMRNVHLAAKGFENEFKELKEYR